MNGLPETSRRTRMTFALAAAIAVIAFLSGAALVAQGAPMPVSQVAALDAMGDVPARIAVSRILDGASARGIPAEPLLTKVREGIAKRSNPDRIRDAVRSLAERLDQSRTALAPAFSVSELSAGAGALLSGVPVPVLRQLRDLSPSAPVTIPLGVLTEMIADGVPPRTAASKILELVRRGATSKHLIEMGAQVRADVASGIAPGTALELRSKRVISLLVAPFTPAFTTPIRPGRP